MPAAQTATATPPVDRPPLPAGAKPLKHRFGPLANGAGFDCGELGFGAAGLTAAANTDTYRTPADLQPGTRTYFCRIHPFMRGAFRVRRS